MKEESSVRGHDEFQEEKKENKGGGRRAYGST
jgi:hypothetical protein